MRVSQSYWFLHTFLRFWPSRIGYLLRARGKSSRRCLRTTPLRRKSCMPRCISVGGDRILTKVRKTWLITGADKGLGFSAAKSALDRGDNVSVTVLASDGGHPLAEQYGDRFRAYHL